MIQLAGTPPGYHWELRLQKHALWVELHQEGKRGRTERVEFAGVYGYENNHFARLVDRIVEASYTVLAEYEGRETARTRQVLAAQLYNYFNMQVTIEDC